MFKYTYSSHEETLSRALTRLLPEFQKRCYELCMESRGDRLGAAYQNFPADYIARAREQAEQQCRLAWLDAVDFHFPRSMRRVVRERNANSDSAKKWAIVELTSVGERLSGDEGWVFAAHTFDEAVAFLAERCIESGFFPDDLTLDGGRLNLLLQGERMATVRTLDQSTSAKPEALQRARSTILRLRVHDDESPLSVLLRRIQDWPGLKRVQASSRFGPPPSMTLPEPSEVLFSAGQLCRVAGIKDHSETLRQEVAAAVLGVPSWNHFASGLGKTGATRLLAPWYIAGADIPPEVEASVFSDVFDAFASYMEMARRVTAQWSEVHLDGVDSIGSHQLPIYWLRESGELSANVRNLDLSPCYVVQASDGFLETATAACLQGVAGLRKLFQLDASSGARFASSQQYRGVSELARDGRWNFALDGDADTFLEVSYLDATGQVARRIVRKARRVQVRWFQEISQHALVYEDVDKAEPIAVLKGVAKDTIEKLKRELGRNEWSFAHRPMKMDDLKPYDQRRLRELVDADIPVSYL